MDPRAALTLSVTTCTSVHCAVPQTIQRSSAVINPRQVITPLLPEAWTTMLFSLGLLPKFCDIPSGLRYGFRLVVSSSLISTTIHNNHLSAENNPLAVHKHINEELTNGRYSGPFSLSTLNTLIGHFCASPLGVVDKPSSPGLFRIIQDFSYPRDNKSISSVNSEINPDLFNCEWGFFQDVREIMLRLPRTAEAATFDVDAAYRCMPVHPEDQPHTVVHWQGNFYLDHCVPFGATSSNGIFGCCGDAMLHIMKNQGIVPVVKWVDDFCIFRSPTKDSTSSTQTFKYTEDDIYALADKLGWPWKKTKTRPFDYSFIYLGFEWNIQDRSVSIPDAKKTKFLAKCQAWQAASSVTLQETESLLGSLIHCALAVPAGCSRVVGIARFTSSFSHAISDRFIKKKPSSHAKEDVNWWTIQLQSGWCGSFLKHPPPHSGTELYMDASTSFGIGVVWPQKSRFGIWSLTKDSFRAGRDIGWAEMVAIEIALSIVISYGTRDSTITFHSDNQGVIGALRAGRSRNDQQNLVLQRIIEAQHSHNIHLAIQYVSTDQNYADGPSRGIAPPNLCAFDTSIILDDALVRFVKPFSGMAPQTFFTPAHAP
ncbi:hypothetical protein RSOLAG1IB_12261 [Rhizoctonia solani AG-1 IB]|uniref:Reverse transcriptase domain-containing protein n=1 Tax=Thanatephorus cucumeris (strain AG1-IB / isolate 7/3/14) TaxID=1108050 RepID=A0A0B7FSC8_THACB|nr:hypothetical protein RSOLAG1IB_12261 [Rhizoctonia solani AG-1 IB]